jgi:hypothetical protein
MNIRLVLAIPVWFILTGCVGYGLKFNSQCPGTPEGKPRLVPVTIAYTPAQIVVAPDPVCVRPGDSLWFRLNGSPNVLVQVEGKNAGDNWISGRGQKSWFTVQVPHQQAEGDYFYTVKAAGSPDLDPEVRVRN